MGKVVGLDISLKQTAVCVIAVGTPITGCPRTEPCGRDSRTRLPPWVPDGETVAWPRMKDARSWKPIVGQLLHPLVCRVVPLIPSRLNIDTRPAALAE
jgi:hypothetical protein